MSTDPPDFPTPPPDIPKGLLWAALSVPSVVTVVGTFVAGSSMSSGSVGEEFLQVLPAGLLTILFCLASFVSAWKVRFRGRSLVLTSIGYLLGQIVLCLGLWFGDCFLIMA